MLLTVQNLSYTYPGSKREILHNIDVAFQPGEIVALVGDNGSGKTTLTKLLVGILKPCSDQIYLGDNDITAMSLAEIGRHLGCVFQNPAQQIFCTSVEKEIAYGLKNQGLDRDEIESRVSYYLDYFELSQYRQTFPLSLSQGEKQRVMLAAILALRPSYVILDEPGTGLDIYRRRLLGEYLLKIKAEGKGVIFVSHQEKFVNQYADRVIQLKAGQVFEVQREASDEKA